MTTNYVVDHIVTTLRTMLNAAIGSEKPAEGSANESLSRLILETLIPAIDFYYKTLDETPTPDAAALADGLAASTARPESDSERRRETGWNYRNWTLS